MVSILNTIMHQKLTGFLKPIRLRPYSFIYQPLQNNIQYQGSSKSCFASSKVRN